MGTIELPSAAGLLPGSWRWPHIDPAREWACKGTGQLLYCPTFLDKIESLRLKCGGKPLAITSGYRSPAHNVAVAQSGPEGPHTTGRAVDIAISGIDALLLICIASQMGFTGIGIKQRNGEAFVHLDDLPDSPARHRPALWTY